MVLDGDRGNPTKDYWSVVFLQKMMVLAGSSDVGWSALAADLVALNSDNV